MGARLTGCAVMVISTRGSRAYAFLEVEAHSQWIRWGRTNSGGCARFRSAERRAGFGFWQRTVDINTGTQWRNGLSSKFDRIVPQRSFEVSTSTEESSKCSVRMLEDF